MVEVASALADAVRAAFEHHADFEHLYASQHIGKPGDGGYLLEGATADPSDVAVITFAGRARLTIEQPTAFTVSATGFLVLDARRVVLESGNDDWRAVADREALVMPTYIGEARLERVSSAVAVWECHYLR
jgi:hypothetical protein